MEVKDKWLMVTFFVLVIVIITTLININSFMPVIATCDDDFAVIDKCGCIPWNNSLTFPNQLAQIKNNLNNLSININNG